MCISSRGETLMKGFSKSKLVLTLITMILLAGAILMPLSGHIIPSHATSTSSQASSGWQLQELWHTDVETPSQLGLIGPNCDGLGGLSDMTYASGTIYETFLYHGICTAQPPNETNGFDAVTGVPVWNQNQLIGGSGSGWQAPLVSNGTMVVPNAYAWTGSAWLEAFDATNDQTPQLWTGVGTDVAVDNGVVYAQDAGPINSGPAGSIYSYDLSSGNVKWQNSDNVCGGYPKIEISNGVVYYIGCSDADGTYSIQARSVTDGSLLWSKAINGPTLPLGLPGLSPSFNSTLVSNGSIFVTSATTDGSNNPTLSSYSNADGTNNWAKPLSDTPTTTCTSTVCSFIGQIIASGSVLYVLEDIAYNHDTHYLPSADIYALDSASGNELWHKSISINGYLYNGGNTAFHGTLVDGVLYFNFSTAIYAFDAATGKQMMMDDTVATGNGKNPISTPLIVGDVMYMTGTNSSGQYTIYAYKIMRQQPVTVQSVWTADSNNNAKTSFAPGDTINYETQVNNPNSTAVTASFTFLATGTQQIFSWSGSQSVAAGTSTITLTSTVPDTAPAGTFTLTVTVTSNSISSQGQSSFIVIPIRANYTFNYSGYDVEGATYSDVRGSWIQPSAICKGVTISKSAIWVGFGGASQTKTLEQAGTTVDCNGSKPKYRAWYEILPADPVYLDQINPKYVVMPTDSIHARVSYQGNGTFFLEIGDSTRGWDFSTTAPGPTSDAARGDADWIVEDPNFPQCHSQTACPLTRFVTSNQPIVQFSNCSVDGKSLSIGPVIERLVISSDSTPGGTLKAFPLKLTNDSAAFGVQWNHQ